MLNNCMHLPNRGFVPTPGSRCAVVGSRPTVVGAARKSGPPSEGKPEDISPPAVQQAKNLHKQQQQQQQQRPAADRGVLPPSVQLADNGYYQQGPGTGTQPVATGSVDYKVRADSVNEGFQAAAGLAEDAILRSAAQAKMGIELASNLTTQGITAADSAAEETMQNLSSAAESTLNAIAALSGGIMGALDGAVGAATSGGGRSSSSDGLGSNGSSFMSTAKFDSPNVRVPNNMSWANSTPLRAGFRDTSATQSFDEEEVEGLKVKILAAVASLDRGLAANVREAHDVDKLCKQLEDAAEPVTLRWSGSRSSPDASTMDKLAGTWRLIYSSAFNGGSLGGMRPGPPAALVPTTLGQVYQVISSDQITLDNVVELLLNYAVPQLPFLPRSDPQPAPGVRLTLRHTYEVVQPNTVTVCFESTSGQTTGPDLLQRLPGFGVPDLPDFLKPPRALRTASFNVTYLDAGMRVTRGDRGELRIYLKDKPLQPPAPTDYVD